MKKISTFRSKGSMKFLFAFLLVITIATVLLLVEDNKLYDYIFIIAIVYYITIVLYYKFIGE